MHDSQGARIIGGRRGFEPAKLKRKRDALAVKVELLTKLDKEIIPEDGLKGKVEGADRIRQ